MTKTNPPATLRHVAGKLQCAKHGERDQTYVCSHLNADAVSLGFNRDEPTADIPFPDAWCNDCEIIRTEAGGWNEDSEKMVQAAIVCSACYERARIRNTNTSVTLNDLKDLRWKCFSCEEWHTGPCLDFAYSQPYYWREGQRSDAAPTELLRDWLDGRITTFLTEDYCAIDNADFFVRGIISLPILGSAESFCWGVWGSVSRDNFKTLLVKHDDEDRVKLTPMFSWLSTRLPDYPDTLNLKMYAHVSSPFKRPQFELEPTDHPLSREHHNGIAAARVKEIMKAGLRETE